MPIDMNTVTVSPKFQVVIPQAIRNALRITVGEKLRVISYADRLEFIPVRSKYIVSVPLCWFSMPIDAGPPATKSSSLRSPASSLNCKTPLPIKSWHRGQERYAHYVETAS